MREIRNYRSRRLVRGIRAEGRRFLAEPVAEVEGKVRGNRTIRWRFFGVENKIDARIMARIRDRAQNAFRISFNYTYQLSSTETDAVMLFYK